MEAIQVQHGESIESRFAELHDEPGAQVAVTLTIVATRGAIGDWAAYFGNAEATPQEVAALGFKLPADTARMIFGNITGKYRD